MERGRSLAAGGTFSAAVKTGAGLQTPRTATARRQLALRLALFYGISFTGLGIYQPFFPVWLASLGLKSAAIGLLLAVPMVLRVFSMPAMSFIADRAGDTVSIIKAAASISLLSFISLAWATTFPAVLVSVALYSLSGPSVVPLGEIVAMAGVRRSGIDYGRVRVWGSISFLVASLVAGVAITWLGTQTTIVMLTAAALATLASAWLLPRGSDGKASNRPARAVGEAPTLGSMLRLFLNPRFALLMAAASAIQGSHGMLWACASLHWQALGYSGTTIAFLFATGVLTEIMML
jgi:MFS transporter, PPP family, 3-phenylpropionic acid transporter